MTFDLTAVALGYVALPTAIFLFGWIVAPLGPIAAVLMMGAALSLIRRERRPISGALGVLWIVIVPIVLLWALLGGLGHVFYANVDWLVRDAVLVDLVRDRWPVLYDVDGVSMMLHAPVGYFLPAAVVGKFYGVTAAEYALLAWTVLGVTLTFALMLRDRPSLKATLIRMAVFIAFSGMDIVGTMTHYKPFGLGEHLEWWAYMFQYSSQTTQLFWVPNHALPGWIAIAWLVGQDPRRIPVGAAILFVAFTPLWSPLTAIGLAPIVGGTLVRRLLVEPPRTSMRQLLDPRVLIPVLATLALVCPYLVAGTGSIVSEPTWHMPWVGEDFVPRYVEFVLLEFGGFVFLLLRRRPRDLLVWIAAGILMALPFWRYGVYNDLAMRASIPPLTLLAIRLGEWLATPSTPSMPPERASRAVAIALLCIGVVTPFMEVARAFVEPRWPMNPRASVIDVIRGAHYITRIDQPWIQRFMKLPDR